MFRPIQNDRDLVLVDQRGTGNSNPLECKADEEKIDEDPAVAIERLRKCMEGLSSKADLRHYTTTIAMDDLEDVREDLPEHLLVGTGAYGRMRPDPEAVEQLQRDGVKVEALPTADAVRRYGDLDPRRTAAALHLTC